ncbi:MAG: hypothetical protein ACTHYC_01995 [Sphingobacterium sp.]
MNKKIAIISIFIWLGFVGAISFMEAWIKFQAPGVTLPVGLGIGRLVFAALNKVEWVLLFISGIGILPFKNTGSTVKVLWLVPAILVLLQTVWMLPLLDARAELHITGEAVAQSNMHFYYVATEVIKVSSLAAMGILLLRRLS